MKNFIYPVVVIICLCFLGKAQAQNTEWTLEETKKVKTEIELLQKEVPLTEGQKKSLADILLEKNRSLMESSKLSVSRRNWGVQVYLTRIEEILLYGSEIPYEESEKRRFKKEARLIERDVYLDKVLNNLKLRKELNLQIIDNTSENDKAL